MLIERRTFDEYVNEQVGGNEPNISVYFSGITPEGVITAVVKQRGVPERSITVQADDLKQELGRLVDDYVNVKLRRAVHPGQTSYQTAPGVVNYAQQPTGQGQPQRTTQ